MLLSLRPASKIAPGVAFGRRRVRRSVAPNSDCVESTHSHLSRLHFLLARKSAEQSRPERRINQALHSASDNQQTMNAAAWVAIFFLACLVLNLVGRVPTARRPLFDCLRSLQSIRPWEEVSVPTRRRDKALALHKAADLERRGQTNQRRLTQLMKKKIAAQDRWTCCRCKKTVDHTYKIDHICPRSKGGSDAPANLRLLCRACHGYITAEQRLASK